MNYQFAPDNPRLSRAYNLRTALKLKQLEREMASEKRKQEVSFAIRTLLSPLTLTRWIIYKADEIMDSIRWQILELYSWWQLPR